MDRDGWNQRDETTELVWTAEPNQFLVAEVDGLAPGTALDLGAGEGRNAVWLAQQGWHVTAVDFSDMGLAKADQLGAVVYLHLPASLRHAVYRRAADRVALGGTMLVVGHDATNPTDGYGGSQNLDVLFTPDDVVADLADGGLLVEKAERVPRPVTTADGPRVAIDALVRARRPEEP